MAEKIEFEKWYSQNDLAYMVIGGSDGTDIFVRGDIHPLHEFVFQLDSVYFTNDIPVNRNLENFDVLKKVLDSGKTELGDVICFKNDRIREIRRMDKAGACYNFKGPFDGSSSHVELKHNEQHGGEYPSNPLSSSRDGIIEKVLQAFSNMRPKEQQISWDWG